MQDDERSTTLWRQKVLSFTTANVRTCFPSARQIKTVCEARNLQSCCSTHWDINSILFYLYSSGLRAKTWQWHIEANEVARTCSIQITRNLMTPTKWISVQNSTTASEKILSSKILPRILKRYGPPVSPWWRIVNQRKWIGRKTRMKIGKDYSGHNFQSAIGRIYNRSVIEALTAIILQRCQPMKYGPIIRRHSISLVHSVLFPNNEM
jgi:hypothetical protein